MICLLVCLLAIKSFEICDYLSTGVVTVQCPAAAATSLENRLPGLAGMPSNSIIRGGRAEFRAGPDREIQSRGW